MAIKIEDEAHSILPKGYFSIIAKKLASQMQDISIETVDFMTEYFEQSQYALRDAHLTQAKARSHIEKSIPQQYTKVGAGELIIGYKETVSAKHIAMIQAMKSALAKKINLFQPLTILGNVLMSLIFISLSIFYLKIEDPKLLKSIKQLSLIVCILLLTFLFAKTTELVILKSRSIVLEAMRYPVIVPFTTLLFSILFNQRLSLFFSAILSITFGVILAVDHSSFLIINMVTSLIVIISTRCLRRRTELFGVCAKCMIGAIPLILALFFVSNRSINFSLIVNLAGIFSTLLIIGIMVVGFLPVLETIFDVLTDITLMEYMDPNNELLRRLTLEIPGSYQHSLVLANLAEAAAQEIHANALFCRVATLYHDIGKLNNPNYFIENQNSGVNIHQLLTPTESAQVIISHVTDGETLGKKYKLPKRIIDIIKQHHGTILVYYFYRKELELKGKDILKVNVSKFRYPGPKPKTKEAAIVMIADGMEAASRSLEVISEKTLTDLVDRLVKEKVEGGQFDDCSLTFEELKIVKKSILKTLLLTRHVRIKYPEKKEEKLSFYLASYCIDKSV